MDGHLANTSRIELVINGLDADLRVLRAEGTEALPQPFLFQLRLAGEDHDGPIRRMRGGD